MRFYNRNIQTIAVILLNGALICPSSYDGTREKEGTVRTGIDARQSLSVDEDPSVRSENKKRCPRVKSRYNRLKPELKVCGAFSLSALLAMSISIAIHVSGCNKGAIHTTVSNSNLTLTDISSTASTVQDLDNSTYESIAAKIYALNENIENCQDEEALTFKEPLTLGTYGLLNNIFANWMQDYNLTLDELRIIGNDYYNKNYYNDSYSLFKCSGNRCSNPLIISDSTIFPLEIQEYWNSMGLKTFGEALEASENVFKDITEDSVWRLAYAAQTIISMKDLGIDIQGMSHNPIGLPIVAYRNSAILRAYSTLIFQYYMRPKLQEILRDQSYKSHGFDTEQHFIDSANAIVMRMNNDIQSYNWSDGIMEPGYAYNSFCAFRRIMNNEAQLTRSTTTIT